MQKLNISIPPQFFSGGWLIFTDVVRANQSLCAFSSAYLEIQVSQYEMST